MIGIFLNREIDGYYLGSMLFSSIAAALLAIFFRVKNNSHLTLAWRLSMVSTSIWSLGRAFLSLANTAEAALGWIRFSYAGSIWLAPFWLWVSYELTGQNVKRAWFWGIGGVTAVFSMANFTPWFIGEVTPKLGFRFYDDAPGFLFEIWSFIFTLLLIWAHFIVFRAMRKATGHQKNRLMAFFVSGLVGFGGSATTFPLVKDVALYPFGVLGVSLSTVLMTYAVVKHRIMDANLAFRYGTMWVAYVFMGLGLSVGPFVLFGAKPTAEWIISSLLAVGGGPFLFHFAMPTITFLVDRLPMFRGRYERFSRLESLFTDIFSAKNLAEWCDTVKDVALILCSTETIALLIKDEHAKRFIVRSSEGFDSATKTFLYLPINSVLASHLSKNRTLFLVESALASCTVQERNQMEDDLTLMGSAICIPIFYDGTLHAIISLGEKPDKEAFNDLELTSLSALARAAEQQLRVILSGLLQEQTTSIWAHDLIKPFSMKGSFQYLEQMLEGSFGPISAETQQAIKLVLNDIGFVKQNLTHVLSPGQGDSYNILSTALTGVYSRVREKYTIESIKRHFSWRVDVPPEDLRVFCDWAMIEHRVLANLIENAFRYTPTEGTVELGWRMTDGKFVGFVKDNGIGIRESDIPKLFKPRSQLEEGSKGLAGLGLFSAKSVVEAHKGRIWVESTFGKGTTFSFELPLASAPHKKDREKLI